jgi:hypothetical protein
MQLFSLSNCTMNLKPSSFKRNLDSHAMAACVSYLLVKRFTESVVKSSGAKLPISGFADVVKSE